MTTESAVTPPPIARRPARMRGDRRSRLARWIFRLAVLVLIVANVARLARDLWPVPDLATILRLETQRRDAEAERAARAFLERSPRQGEARMILARLLARRGDRLGAARELHRVPRWWPSKRLAEFLEGEAFSKVHHAREAEAAWRACIVDDPLHPTPPAYRKAAAEGLLMIFFVEERRADASAIIWSTYDQAEPIDRPDIMTMRLRTELERPDPAEARATLRRYLAADPGDWQARRALAKMEQATGHPDAADQQIAVCLEQRPNDPLVWRDRLKILDVRGDRPALIAAAARVPATCAQDPEIWLYRGIAHEAAGDLDAARRAFAESVRLDPYGAEALYRLSRAERQAGDPRAAEAHSRRSQAIRTARQGLKTALARYHEVTQTAAPDPSALTRASATIAEHCRALGWARDAEAWAALAPVD